MAQLSHLLHFNVFANNCVTYGYLISNWESVRLMGIGAVQIRCDSVYFTPQNITVWHILLLFAHESRQTSSKLDLKHTEFNLNKQENIQK